MLEKTIYYQLLTTMGRVRLRIFDGEWWLRVEGYVNRIPIACSGRGDTPEQAMLNLVARLVVFGRDRQAWAWTMTQYVKGEQRKATLQGKSLFEGILWKLLSGDNQLVLVRYGDQARCMYTHESIISCQTPIKASPLEALEALADDCVLKDQWWWLHRLNSYFAQQHEQQHERLKKGLQ